LTSDINDAVTVRPATPADAAACRDIYAPIVSETPTSFETEVPSIGEFERRIETTTRVYPWLVAENGGRVVGYAYARRHRSRPAYRWSVEVSVFVAETARRRGSGRVLYSALIDILKRQGFYNAYAGIALPNPASVAFHESMGFVPVGVYQKAGYKLNRWHDVGWWALRLGDDGEPPSDPVPFSADDGT
jgi:phosphinothricin acetyltransferase